MQFIGYNTSGAQIYTQTQRVARVENCNGFVAVNVGDTIVRVNGQILHPGVIGTANGESINVGGNLGEVYQGYISVEFAAPLGAAPAVAITQKYYVLDKILASSDLVNGL